MAMAGAPHQPNILTGERMMKRSLLTAAFLISIAPGLTHAADRGPATPAAADTGRLSVLQLMNISDALRQLGDYRDVSGKAVKVPFEFDGGTRMTFAIDISHADDAVTIYQKQHSELLQKLLGDRLERLAALDQAATAETDAAVKKQKVAAAEALRAETTPLVQKLNEQNAHMLAAPGGALLSRIKESDLCMAAKPVAPCTVTNAIPPSLLAALVPIIDR